MIINRQLLMRIGVIILIATLIVLGVVAMGAAAEDCEKHGGHIVNKGGWGFTPSYDPKLKTTIMKYQYVTTPTCVGQTS